MKTVKKQTTKKQNLKLKTKIITGALGVGLLGTGIGISLFLRNKNIFLSEIELKKKSIQQLKNILNNLKSLLNKCWSDIVKEEKKQRNKYKTDILNKKLEDNNKISSTLGKRLGEVLEKYYSNKKQERSGGSGIPYSEKDELITEIIFEQDELKKCYDYLKLTPDRIKNEQIEYINKIKNQEKKSANKLWNIGRFS